MTDTFLKTIRFDGSDAHAFAHAAEPDEWAVSGAFAFANLAREEITGKTRQAFANGFLGLDSFGRATFTAVAPINATEIEQLELRLARHFVDAYGAPDIDAARGAAQEEIDFVADLTKGVLINTLFVVSRAFDDDGRIRESFRRLERRIDGGPIQLAPDQAPETEGNTNAG